MTTILPPPTAEDWTSPYPPYVAADGRVVFEDVGGSAVTLTVGNLMPGHTLDVALDVTLAFYGSGQSVATIADTALTGLTNMARQTLHATVAVADALECTFSGFASLTVHSVTLIDHATVPDQPLPAHVLSLLAWLPVLGVDAFRLGASRLDRDALSEGVPPTTVFTLGRDKLGARRLWQASSTHEWRDLLPPATAVSATRGVSASGPIFSAQVGTLTATAWDDWDPRTTGLHHGTPIRLIHWPTRRRIFTGSVVDLQIKPERPDSRHRYETTLTAADAVAVLAGTTRYGAKSNGTAGAESWDARIASLMESTEIPYTVEGSSTTTMCPTVWETSLAKHLDAACASIAGAWAVGVDSTVEILAALPTQAPVLTLTDDHATDLDEDMWSYTDVDATWAASDAITSIDATSHIALIGDDNTWQAADETLTVTDRSTTYAWGGTSATVDLTVPLEHLEAAATRLLRSIPDVPAPSQVTLSASNRYGPPHRAEHMARAAALDVLQPVRTTQRHESTNALTTTITHTISPRAWTTVLTLTDRSTR